MKQYENDQPVTSQYAVSDQPENDGALDVEALYAQCIEIEARDYAVGRVLCALVRHMAGANGQDVPAHEAQAVAAMGTQVVAEPIEDNTDEPKTAAEDADVSKTAPEKNVAKGDYTYGN